MQASMCVTKSLFYSLKREINKNVAKVKQNDHKQGLFIFIICKINVLSFTSESFKTSLEGMGRRESL